MVFLLGFSIKYSKDVTIQVMIRDNNSSPCFVKRCVSNNSLNTILKANKNVPIKIVLFI